MTASEALHIAITEEDGLRAGMYRLLANFLRAAPDRDSLAAAAALGGDQSELGSAITGFARIAANTAPSQAREEYQDLFIGIGRGELVPYASYYLTGFLNEKPLAKLRADMARLGIERVPGNRDPEDHIAALCEMMAGLIEGTFDAPADLDRQKKFFNTHVATWAGHFFKDLEGASASRLYAGAGAVGSAFMAVEQAAFAMIGTNEQ